MHVHVQHAKGEAKFWLDPEIDLAQNYGLGTTQLTTARRLIQEYEDEIREAWHVQFPG